MKRYRCCLKSLGAATAYDAASGADCIIVLTEWNEFRAINLARLGKVMRTRRIADLRNLYDPADAVSHGFAYTGVGRGKAPS